MFDFLLDSGFRFHFARARGDYLIYRCSPHPHPPLARVAADRQTDSRAAHSSFLRAIASKRCHGQFGGRPVARMRCTHNINVHLNVRI